MTNPVRLDEIVPQGSSFFLEATKQTYKLRPVVLTDEIWLTKEYGEEKLKTIFTNGNMIEICRIVFHQMEPESQKLLKKQTVSLMNEEGDEVTETLGGVKLLYALVSGFKEKGDIMNALLQTIGMSRPIVERIASTLNDEEKKSQNQPTGLKSSTDSAPNTDGQPNISSAEPNEKLTGA